MLLFRSSLDRYDAPFFRLPPFRHGHVECKTFVARSSCLASLMPTRCRHAVHARRRACCIDARRQRWRPARLPSRVFIVQPDARQHRLAQSRQANNADAWRSAAMSLPAAESRCVAKRRHMRKRGAVHKHCRRAAPNVGAALPPRPPFVLPMMSPDLSEWRRKRARVRRSRALFADGMIAADFLSTVPVCTSHILFSCLLLNAAMPPFRSYYV